MAAEAKTQIRALIEEDNLAEAERLAAQNLDSFRSKSDNAGIATMLLMTAEAALAGMSAQKALKAARDAWPIAKGLDKKLQGEVLVAMVNGLNMSGQSKETVRAANSSLATVAGDPSLEAAMYHALAVAHLKLDDHEDALEAEEKALNLAKSAGDKKAEAVSMTSIAKAQRGLGKFDKAIETAKEAAALWRSMGQAAGIVACVETISDAQAAQGFPKAALVAAEEELSLLKKAGCNTRNELIMMEKVVQVASEQGQNLEALRAMEDMIKVCTNAGDKKNEAQKTFQAAEMHMEMNHSQDALRLAKNAEDLFQSLNMKSRAEDARKLVTKIYVKKGQHSKAPHRSEALLALKQFVRAVEQRETDQVKQFEVDLDKASSAIKDTEMSTALESLFERDPTAISFLEQQGWDLTSFKVPTKIYQFPHKAFYLTTVAGGMNFGPQFRSVNPYRKGKIGDDPRACSVCCLPETEAWQGQLMYRHGIMDAGIQASGSFNFPPN